MYAIKKPGTMLTKLLLTAALTLSSHSAFSEATEWYQVELALIAHQDEAMVDHENWPDVMAARAIELPDNAFDWLNWWHRPQSSAGLYNVSSAIKTAPLLQKPFISNGEAFADKLQKINRRKDMQVVWSDRWLQPIPEKNQAEQDENQVVINLRKPFSNKETMDIEVTGKLHLYRSRYLHLVSDLQIQHWQHLGKDSSVDKALGTPLCSEQDSENRMPASNATPLTPLCEVPTRAALVQQSRRMRSNELHYIDHPMVGIMVRAIPVDELPKQEAAAD